MHKLTEGILDIIDNFLSFLLRNDKKGAARYLKAHPELKGKRKEIKKAFKDADDAFEKAMKFYENSENKPSKLKFLREYLNQKR